MLTNDIEFKLKKAQEYNQKHAYTSCKKYFQEKRIGKYPCLVIPKKSDKAILFIHGGMNNCWDSECLIARWYAYYSSMEVWYPIYPACTEVSIVKTIHALYDVYKEMLKKYDASKIAIIGDSFGGMYAFEILHLINTYHEVSMPQLLIANSPAGFPKDEIGWNQMKQYSKFDFMISLQDMKLSMELIKTFGSIPDYALYPTCQNFSNACQTYVYYTRETCAGNAVEYVKAYKKCGSKDKMHMHIKPHRAHGFSCMPIFKEYKEQIQLLKGM